MFRQLTICVLSAVVVAGDAFGGPGGKGRRPGRRPRDASTASVPPASPGPLAAGNARFAADLYGQLRGRSGDLFCSPYSISTALAMTSAGARGETLAQMRSVLHFELPQAELHAAFGDLQAGLNAVAAKGEVKLSVANALWPHKTYAFRPEFIHLVERSYSAATTPLDYAGATEAARRTINTWVEDRTQDKIRDLIAPGILNALTRLVLTNAIYFKGRWASQFDAKLTKRQDFFAASGKTPKVPLMTQEARFGYRADAEAQILELPYQGGDLSMVVVLPRDRHGLSALEASLDADKLLAWTGRLPRRKVRVFLPRFKITASFTLNEPLTALGMTDAFSQMKADFSGMDGSRNLYISAVLHKAFVEVNEEGTEAAAATAVVIGLRSARIERPPVFRADHPFLFLIRDNRTGSVLFLGRLSKPAA